MSIEGFDHNVVSGECITPADLNIELLRGVSIAV